MQVNKVSGIQIANTAYVNPDKENKSFKDYIGKEKTQSKLECNDLKTGKNGELYGLVNNRWQNFNIDFSEMTCGPDEILVIGDDFVKVGINLVKNFGMLAKTPFAVQEDTGFSDMINGLALVPGKMVDLLDGTILKWTKNGVEYVPRKTNNPDERAKALKYAASLANTMNQFTRVANKQALGVGKVLGITSEKTQDIKNVLTAMGIDTNNDFYVNGKKFMFDETSGEFKYTFENSIDGKYGVRYINTPTIKLV